MTMFKLGRLSNQGRPRVRLTREHVSAATPPPPTVDRYSAAPEASWGVDGNDAVGDCTIADVDHEVKSAQVAAGNTEVASTTTEVLAGYSAVTGYDPADPSTDQGAEMQAVREYWQKTGFTLGGQRHKIAMFAELDIHDEDLIKLAVYELGAVGVGANLPQSAMDQFDAGQPWDVVADDGGILGGHAFAVVGYDKDFLEVLTWGKVQKVTWAWWRMYVEEAWGSLTNDFVSSRSGTDPLGETWYQLGEQFSSLTGKPNPVPAPSPTPTPVPTPRPPSPVNPPDAADIALVATLGPWSRGHHVGGNETAARAFQSWRAAKGL